VADAEVPAVYFTATLETDPTQAHLFWSPLFGDLKGGAGPHCQITRVEGSHSALVNVQRGYFVDIVSNTSTPSAITINRLSDGALIARLGPEMSDLELARTKILEPPEITTLEARQP